MPKIKHSVHVPQTKPQGGMANKNKAIIKAPEMARVMIFRTLLSALATWACCDFAVVEVEVEDVLVADASRWVNRVDESPKRVKFTTFSCVVVVVVVLVVVVGADGISVRSVAGSPFSCSAGISVTVMLRERLLQLPATFSKGESPAEVLSTMVDDEGCPDDTGVSSLF